MSSPADHYGYAEQLLSDVRDFELDDPRRLALTLQAVGHGLLATARVERVVVPRVDVVERELADVESQLEQRAQQRRASR